MTKLNLICLFSLTSTKEIKMKYPNYLVTGIFPFVGGAQVEAKLEDSVSGQVLAAIVDKRLGSGSATAGFQWRWGDVQNAMDFWAESPANRFSDWISEKEKP
jgi:hypothetical protein